MNIKVILHTAGGDVVTSYGPNCDSHALSLIRQYVEEGKSFSVIQKKF